MTQALDAHGELASFGRAPAADAPVSSVGRRGMSKFGTFAITFGISFAILYTICEQMNWPAFTYHPAVGKLDLGMQRARSGEGPPMYWYGWLVVTTFGALVVSTIATMVSRQALYRATTFCCVLALLWSALYALGIYTADRTTFDTEFLRLPWVSAIPAFVAAGAAAYLASPQWESRVWTGWLLIMPIGGLVILGYSLKQYFLR